MKEIEIIPLAKRKMIRRGISLAWINETLQHPEQTVPGYGGRLVAHRRFEKGGKMRLLRVVYEETETKTLVITTYLTSQVARYWKEKKGEN